MKNRPVCLIIMDGYGLDKPSQINAVSIAKKPNLDRIFKEYGYKTLGASGEYVGLPDGQMGNSEVGHMNIGAGRIVWQSLSRINNAIKSGEFNNNEAINEAIDNALKNGKKFHIFGLCSDGGVHSHVNHIIAIANLAHQKGIKNVYYHAFLDGRDVDPQSACGYLEQIINGGDVKVATVGGRYYGMDRDKNYDRIQKAYDAMTIAKGEYFENPIDGIKASYAAGVTDEFVVPFVSDKNGMVESGDSVVFANFRPDRAIQIATAFSNPEAIKVGTPLVKEGMQPLDTSHAPKNIFFVSMMLYAESVKGEIAFGLQNLDNTFGDILPKYGKKQLRIAETEKYAHVTFFFDGGVDKQIEGSKRVLVNSPKVATYDLKPEMSAYEVTEKVLYEIENDTPDAIVLNFANCDMVGHTGVIPAAVKAVEAVDDCVGQVVNAVMAKGGVCVIIADHGNADKMLDEEGKPFTAHTTNPVPVIVTDKNVTVENGILSDVAPTLLHYLEIPQPKEMTGKCLVKEK